MTAADIAPWATPAITIALIAWLRMDLNRRIDRLEERMDKRMEGFDARLRALEVAVGAIAAKLDLLERYLLRPNEPLEKPTPEASD